MVNPVREVLFYLLAPLTVYLTGKIFLFAQSLMSEFITKLRKFGCKYQIFDKISRNKHYPVFLGENHISRQNSSPSDTYRGINGCKHHLLYICLLYTSDAADEEDSV